MTAYFDNAATTRVCPEAAAAVMEAMTECYGNPSSGHLIGRSAAALLRTSRENVAAALGTAAEEVYFTSGGTEGDNWAIRGACRLMRHRGRHIITGSTEHDAVRHTVEALKGKGWEVTYLEPSKSGRIEPESVAKALRKDTVLVSLMLINNETGAETPISEIFEYVKSCSQDAILHTDAVQGFLKVPFTPKKLGADLVTVSSHKIHGPKGVGALYVRKGLRLPQLITGGGQEGGFRPGTEPMPAIAGFGAAALVGKTGFSENTRHIKEIRDYTLERLKAALPEAIIIGEGTAPHVLSISLPGYRSEVLMNVLDAAGICVSKSSACRKGARSHVLEAMKLPNDVIDGAIRLSFSRYNTKEEVDYFIKTLSDAASKLRRKL